LAKAIILDLTHAITSGDDSIGLVAVWLTPSPELVWARSHSANGLPLRPSRTHLGCQTHQTCRTPLNRPPQPREAPRHDQLKAGPVFFSGVRALSFQRSDT
jgi:hypothetical protein